jgi:myo-inositol-1(or 4)-monophosphatase
VEQLNQLRCTATEVARQAAEVVSEAREGALRAVQTKSSETDVVTAGDRAAEQFVRRRLAELRPGEPVLGEEEDGDDGDAAAPSGLRWVVDPIDGTVNYLYGYPWYSVSVAVESDGVSLAGAIVEPVSGRLWSAARGQGATLDGVALRASATTRLDLTLVATGFGYRPDRRRRQAAMIAELLGRVRDLRRAGSASLDLCAVAAGWVDGYVEHGLHRWDWSAGALIAEEAGAVVRLPGAQSDLGESGLGESGLGDDVLFAAAPGVADELANALIDCGIAAV